MFLFCSRRDTGLRMMSSGKAPVEADPRPGSGEGRKVVCVCIDPFPVAVTECTRQVSKKGKLI